MAERYGSRAGPERASPAVGSHHFFRRFHGLSAVRNGAVSAGGFVNLDRAGLRPRQPGVYRSRIESERCHSKFPGDRPKYVAKSFHTISSLQIDQFCKELIEPPRVRLTLLIGAGGGYAGSDRVTATPPRIPTAPKKR